MPDNEHKAGLPESEKTLVYTPERIYEDLLHLIHNGTYKPGDKIPSENELKNVYGTSRNTVRLALNKLNTLGILETRKGGGSYVCQIGSNISLRAVVPNLLFQAHDLADVLEFRKGIETQAVKLAAQRTTEEDLKRLRASLARMKRYQNDMRLFEDADTEMHIQIARASKNEMYRSMLEIIIQSILTDEMKDLLIKQGSDIDSLFYHQAILSCIEHHKPVEAGFLMERHLDLIMKRVIGKQEHTTAPSDLEIDLSELY